MNLTGSIETSLILIFIYIIVRGTGRRYFQDGENRGVGFLILILGTLIFLFVSTTIGIITILPGVALLLIPEKKTKSEIPEK